MGFDVTQSPLFLLATSMAYLIEADTRTTFEEKAQLAAALGKHVSSGEISREELHAIVADAFDYAEDNSVDSFLVDLGTTLTPGQKTAVIINMYDAMLVDGSVAVGEKRVMQKFVNSFGLGRNTMKVIREIIMIKNDTTVFTDQSHPQNDPKYVLDVKMFDAISSSSPVQLTDALPGGKPRWGGGDSD